LLGPVAASLPQVLDAESSRQVRLVRTALQDEMQAGLGHASPTLLAQWHDLDRHFREHIAPYKFGAMARTLNKEAPGHPEALYQGYTQDSYRNYR